MKRPEYIVGITGASGSILGITLIAELLKRNIPVGVIITDSGKKTLCHELKVNQDDNFSLVSIIEQEVGSVPQGLLSEYDNTDFFTPPASGSSKWKGIAVVPASMKTLSAAATAYTDSLLTRAIDVSLKEKRKTVLVSRESPVHSIHLANMLTCADMGASIVLPVPAFYNFPETISDIVNHTVGKVLEHLGVETDLVKEWKGD